MIPKSISDRSERITAIKHLLASIFASQKAIRALAPEFKWSGLGNLLGDYGELVAIEHYGLTKAPSGSDGSNQSELRSKPNRIPRFSGIAASNQHSR